MAEERALASAPRRRTPLGWVADLVVAHPRWIVAVWVLVIGGLSIAGKSLEGDVSTRPIYVSGGAAERAHEIARREFGDEEALVVMLHGPSAAVERQGPRLVESLRTLPKTLVISPWSSNGTIEGLHPKPGVAAVLVSIGQTSTAANTDIVPTVRGKVGETVSAPVRVDVAGGPAVVDSLRASVKRATSFGELLAIPVLVLVLLLVCRSPLAAAIPVIIGGLITSATQGVLDLCTGITTIDSIAIGISAMFGLGLGIDYSLLVISRFREECEKGQEVGEAVRATVLASGRSILPAGGGLTLAMLVSLAVLPGSLVITSALAVIAAALLSVVSAMFLAPAVLALLGARIDRWALPRRRAGGAIAMGWSRGLSSRPAVVLGLVFALFVCSAFAFALKSGTGSVAQLPPDDPGRLQQENIERHLGPGWLAPFEIVMTSDDGPVTTAKRLNALSDFQRRVERDPGVEAMAGFAGLQGTTAKLASAEASYDEQEKGLNRLDRGLAGTQHGAASTSAGFGRAAGGARQIDAALGQAKTGSGKLTDGLKQTSRGSQRLTTGVGRAGEGSGKLTAATSKATSGAGRLADSIAKAQQRAAEAVESSQPLKNSLLTGEETLAAAPLAGAEEQIGAAWQALRGMTSGRSDPRYAEAVEAVRQASRTISGTDPAGEEEAEVSADSVTATVRRAMNQFNLALYLTARQEKNGRKASDGMTRLAKAAKKLEAGLAKLLTHSRKLSAGLDKLSRSGQRLPDGLLRLAAGAGRLSGGLGEIESGAAGLAGGLDGGARKSQRLVSALGQLHAGVEKQRDPSSASLSERSPGLFRSGYFFLAGLDGSKPQQRNQAGLLVDVANGGGAARMLVIPKDEPGSSGIAATADHLDIQTARLARETGTEAVVGGLPPSLIELNSTLREEALPARLALALVSVVILLAVTRSLALALIGAVLNLFTVSATFGLLAILFNSSILGGPGYVDSSAIPAVVVLTFGLAIDFEVFIYARIREEYLKTGSTSQAVTDGLGRTAHVVSGAAIIMISVFLAFSVSDLMAIRNLGVSQAIGVFIDAFVIRFVVLPATMRALGDRCWWTPRWLDRLLPGRSAPAREAVA
ncbi:MAG TPA: MMPL family transporter [Solirubrobacterales bacterium]|nr:MMPL family transporter [Solirubrobacterales bacterium]